MFVRWEARCQTFSIGKTYRLTLVPESAAPPEAKGVNTSDDFTDRFTAERFFVQQIEEVK